MSAGEEAEAAPNPASPWRLIGLISFLETEPPQPIAKQEALASWAAVSALWHPAILARVDRLPRLEDLEQPAGPERDELRLLAPGCAERLPSGYRTQVEDAGSVLIDPEGETDRLALARLVLERIDPDASLGAEDDAVAADFLALGTARWMLRVLTVAMGHIDNLDVESLTREVLAGARAWQSGDMPGAINRLRAAFELLTQARERFYPVDAYLIDLCLFDPNTPAADLDELFAQRTPVSLVAPAKAFETLAERDPERLPAIRAAVTDGWLDIAGGSYAEEDEAFLPVESILWQFRKAADVYRDHIEGRTVETLARRRFALYPMLPQIAKKFSCRFGAHLAFDDGKFPVRTETKRLWESPDGTQLEVLTRAPLPADQDETILTLPWRLARSLKDDHVATVVLVHWPRPLAGWYRDLRRVASYSPVFARWVTLSDFFHLTDRPFETFRPELDEYQPAYLAQAAIRQDRELISRRASHARLRARLDALLYLDALATAITGPLPGNETATLHHGLRQLEDRFESGKVDEARAAMDEQERLRGERMIPLIVGTEQEQRPGYLVLNPTGVARRMPVLLPDASPDLRPEGPMLAAQLTEEGVWAIVDLPAFGFAWIPRENSAEQMPAQGAALVANGRTLQNQFLEVTVDEATGGIRALKAPGEGSPRLGQQLILTGVVGPDGKAAHATMKGTSYEVDYAGPALLQASTSGTLLDPRDKRPLASFRQRLRLWHSRPTLEVDVTLSQVDSEWFDRAARGDPWHRHIACRWAWPDPEASLRRLSLLGAFTTEAERPETPDAFEIATRRQRTLLLFGGLAHHQRHGLRMLDTLLVAGSETARAFRLGVALNLEHPFQAAIDFTSPVIVIPTDAGPPRTGPTGWFFQVDHRAVAVTGVSYVDRSGDGRGWGLVFHLVETAGRSARCRLRLFRNPVWARQTDYNDELIIDLTVDDDSVFIDLTPHEMVRVDVTLG